MATLKMNFGLPATPADGLRSRRKHEAASRTTSQRLNYSLAAKESGTTGTNYSTYSAQMQPSDRIPRSISTQRTGLPRPSPRLPSEPSTRIASPPGRDIGAAFTHSPNLSSSSSSLPQDAGRKPKPSISSKRKPPVSHDAASVRKVNASKSSSLSRFESRVPRAPNDKVSTTLRAPRETAKTHDDVKARHKPDMSTAIMYPELDRYRNLQLPEHHIKRQELEVPYRLATHDLPPPTPASLLFSGSSSQISTISGSPSTRLSESPGPGPYSRDTTPTSTCSQSPVLVIPSRLKVPARVQQGNSSFIRQPLACRGQGCGSHTTELTPPAAQDLTPIRESVTSSSSSSTVRDGDKSVSKDGRLLRHASPMIPETVTRKPSHKSEHGHFDVPRGTRNRTAGDGLQSKVEEPFNGKSPGAARSETPARPSRAGTPDLHIRPLEPAPVIQSNLSLSQKPLDKRHNGNASSTSLASSIASLSQSRKNASTPQLTAIQRTTSRTESPHAPSHSRRANSQDSPRSEQTSAKPSSSFSTRFPFFGRRKNVPEIPADNKVERSPPKKPTRKGPVAGTGHEGYGRFGVIRRRSSSGSTLSRRLTEPQENGLGGNDSFLADRVRPVVIAGGEVVENKNTTAESGLVDTEKSVNFRRPSTPMKACSKRISVNEKSSRNTLWPSPLISNDRGFADTSNLPKNISNGTAEKPTLAFRRSLQRLRLSVDNPIRLPQPINTTLPISASPMTSIDTTVTSEDSHKFGKESSRGFNENRKFPKAARLTRKWNFFGRSHSRQNASASSEEVQATVKAVVPKRVAFYTMMDSSEQEDNVSQALEDGKLLSDNPISALDLNQPPKASPAVESVFNHAQTIANQGGPTQPIQGIEKAPEPLLGPSKRGRLQQVGRIPQVVSSRAEVNVTPTFSRPFTGIPCSPPKKKLSLYDPDSIATGPSPPNSASLAVRPRSDEAAADSGNNTSSSRDSASKLSSEVARGEREFFSFPRRNHSVATIDTSSSGSREICIVADATAVIPKPHDPLHEDEIWDEYNDLLDDDSAKMFLSTLPPATVAPKVKPRKSRSIRGDSIMSIARPSIRRNVSTLSRAPSHASSASADMTERIRKAFQQQPSPPVVHTMTANPSLEMQHPAVSSNIGGFTATNRQSSASGKTVFTDCSTISSEEESPLAQVNLRVGSMTVSKWLSFGHVLFSDIRHELDICNTASEKQSILVIDGLGNDDWSFYAAETYPRASLYNLSPRAALPAEMRSSPSSFPLSPANHHQVQYTSHLDKFPFAPQSFNCLVYRFPVAAPESHYRNIINEARRVLQPGGYIELSVLDVDLNNMGNRGRRTVRRLKERIHQEAADVNLSSTADLILRLMNTAGFSNIKAARVGVPVASSITRNDTQMGHREKPKLKETSSLADMIKDHSPTADEGINKLVTRVGRWWYTQCYENAVGPSTSKSIWSSKTLLSECEERGTSLKLMVCCARAPSRTPSV